MRHRPPVVFGSGMGLTFRSARSRVVGALERVAERQLACGRRERGRRARGQGSRASPPRMSAPTRPGSSAKTDSGAGADQDADGGAREPGHQGEGDTEEAELGFVARHHLGHPDRGRGREHRRRDAGDHPGREQDPRPHLAQQEEPRGEPPQRRRDRPAPRWRRARPRAHRGPRRPDRRGVPCTTRTASRQTSPASRRRLPVRGGRRQARRYTRWSAVVNELAKKMVSTRPSRPVACRTSSDDAKAPLASVQRVAPDAQPERDGGDERRTDALGREGRDDDHQREERDERLPGERDAAIDELDLEHALPHPPEEQALQPSSQNGHALGHFAAPCARGRRLACRLTVSTRPGRRRSRS